MGATIRRALAVAGIEAFLRERLRAATDWSFSTAPARRREIRYSRHRLSHCVASIASLVGHTA